MIKTHIIHPSAATSTVFLVEIVVSAQGVALPLRKYVIVGDCQNAGVQPTGAVSFTVSPTRILNDLAVATITAHVSTMTPKCQLCGCATPQVFTESFDIAFNVTGTNTITLEQGAQTITEPAYKGCCAARGIKLITTLTANIA